MARRNADGTTDYIEHQLYDLAQKTLTFEERKQRALGHATRLLLGYIDDRGVRLSGKLDHVELYHTDNPDLLRIQLYKALSNRLSSFLYNGELSPDVLATEIASKAYGLPEYSIRRGRMHTPKRKSMSRKSG